MSIDATKHPGGLNLTDRAFRLSGLPIGAVLLDVGCGEGHSLNYLANKYGIEPYGIDISIDAIQRASQIISKANLTCADAHFMPYEAEFFDGVICECALSVVSQPSGILSEIYRVLKPGGILIASDICDAFGLDEIGKIYTDNGFNIRHFEDHKSALITYLSVLRMQAVDLSTECSPTCDDDYNTRRKKQTYYLAICQRN